MKALPLIGSLLLAPGAPRWSLSISITVAFAVLAWLVGGVSGTGAVAGAVISLALLAGAGWGGFLALCSVFLLTWFATRTGYSEKQRLGTAEARRGRNARQVFANLGLAAIFALLQAFHPNFRLAMAMTAALAEAAADTVASEIGQALGGPPRLITSWQLVAVGSDGALTWVGTVAGVTSAILVSLICNVFGIIRFHELSRTSLAAVAGMLADSILGATLERRGAVGNNAVNLISTGIAAGIAVLLS